MAPNGAREMFGAAVFQVIAGDRSNDDVFELQSSDGFGDPLRFIFLERKGFAVLTAQNPQARVQRSPAIIMVAVPWLQHSQRFGHCALSQTVCRRRSEMSALVEKKTGFDGRRTLIQGGFCAWCNAGSILAQDMFGSFKFEALSFKWGERKST